MSRLEKSVKKNFLLYFFLFFVFIGLFVIFKSRNEPLKFKLPKANTFDTGWYYYDEDGYKHYIDSLPAVIPSKTPITRIYHFYSSIHPQEICFYTHHQTAKFSMNGKILYEYSIKGNPSWLADYRSFYHIVRLPPMRKGEMCLLLEPVGKKYIGEYDTIYIGTHQEIITRIIIERMDKLILGIILLVITLICFLLSNLYKRNFSKDKMLLHQSFLTFAFGLWTLEESKLLQFVIQNQGVHWCLEYLNQNFILIAAYLFVNDVTIESKARLTKLLQHSSIIVAAVIAVLQLTGTVQLYRSMFILQLYSVLFCIYITYLVNKGNFFHKKSRGKMFNLLMVLSVIVFIVIILGHFNKSYGNYFMDAAIIFLFTSFLFITNQRTLDKYEAIQQAMLYQKLAFVDFNTGVASKTAWFSLIEKFDPEKTPMINCCLMLFDMNNLKKLNDTKGHLFGDKVISTFCSCLTKTFEDDGTVFRIGGDEFICFCRHSSEDEIEKKVKVFEAMENSYRGTELEFSCAYGYVFFTPHTKDDFNKAQERADSLMYEMKKRMKIGREFGC